MNWKIKSDSTVKFGRLSTVDDYHLFPVCAGEEIDMDLVSLEQTDSPILWIRIDSAMTILREVKIEQV